MAIILDNSNETEITVLDAAPDHIYLYVKPYTIPLLPVLFSFVWLIMLTIVNSFFISIFYRSLGTRTASIY